MKKLAILLAVALVLGISLGAYAAGAEKIDFVHTGAGGEAHANANGWLIINKTPGGATEVVIQIQIRDAASQHEYTVKSGGDTLGTFTTNKKGSGHFHCNLSSEDLGPYINIWTPSVRILRAHIAPYMAG